MAAATERRIGIFGGTFDPVHLGHLILAEQCREHGHLDEVWFVPGYVPPHKQDRPLAPFEQRVEMIELAIAGNAAFRVDTIERELPDPNYTANTLAEMHRRYPGAELLLLIGSDSLNDLPRWFQPQRIIASAGLLVMQRARYGRKPTEELRADLELAESVPLRVEWVEAPPLIDIASSDLRARVGRGNSIRYLVPRAVEVYIKEKRLYASA
jgi:nicotinate-nucleotide adenylyltransferase